MLDPVRRALAALLATLVLPGMVVVATAPAAHAELEDFASYQPEERCSPKAKAGAEYLAGWLVRTYGGARGRVGAACTDSVSEHQEGRAVDWSNDATTKAGRARVKEFLHDVLAEDHRDRPAATARRMGIMYVIWDDRMWSAWDGFDPRALPQLLLQEAQEVLEDPAAPRPRARLAEPQGRLRPHQLLRRQGREEEGLTRTAEPSEKNPRAVTSAPQRRADVTARG